MQQRNRIYLDDILLFYQVTKHEEEGTRDTLSLQAYPSNHYRISAIVGYAMDPGNIEEYSLPLFDVEIGYLDTITLHIQENSYVFAGGIWQVRYTHPKEGYELFCTCSSLVDLRKVPLLPSDEDEHLVEEAVDQAEAFLKPYCFSPSLLTCHEMDEQTAMPVAQGFLRGGKQRRHVWHMLWDCMINDEAPSALAVTYDPQQTPPFSVSLL
jgi:hypothetical protein